MKTNRIMVLIGTLGVLAAATALAQPVQGDESTTASPAQGRPGWNRPDPAARKQALLERYDANKDGKLDEAERAAIGKDVEEGTFRPLMAGRGAGQGYGRGPRGPRADVGPGYGRGPRGPRGQGQAGFGRGPQGPRALGGPGYGPRHQEMLDKYDANKNGQIDDVEREAIRKDIQSGKLERPHWGPPAGRGFGPPAGQGQGPGADQAPVDEQSLN